MNFMVKYILYNMTVILESKLSLNLFITMKALISISNKSAFCIYLQLYKYEWTNPAKKQRIVVNRVIVIYDYCLFFIPSIKTQPDVLDNRLWTNKYPIEQNINTISKIRIVMIRLILSLKE